MARYAAHYCSYVFSFVYVESIMTSVEYYHCYDYAIGFVEACMFSMFIVMNRHGSARLFYAILLVGIVIALVSHLFSGATHAHVHYAQLN